MRLEAALQLSSISKEKKLSHRQGGWAGLSTTEVVFWLRLSILFLMSVLLVKRLLLASVFYLALLRLLVDA